MAAFTPFTIYPHSSVQAISCLIHFLGVSILTHCISRRFTSEIFPTWHSLIHQWPRLCVVIAFADSWLFVFFAGMLLFGIGLQYNSGVCAAAIHLCIVFYGTSKIMIYAFLTEKVYLVWANGRDRLRTPAYMISVVAVGLYVVPVLLMIIGRVHEFQEGDGVCIIGVSHISSLAVLSYDLFISFALTGLFLWPLLRADILNPRLRRAAFRTMIAAFISLIMSTINIAVLAALHGKEYGWLCLGSCSIDVITNALALFWVTSTSSERSQETSASQRDQKHSHIVMSRMQSQAQKGNTTTISDHASPGFAELIKSSPNAARGLQITVTSERDVDGDSEDIKKDYPDSSN